MPAAIERLPEAEWEAFDRVRIREMTQAEAARVLGISVVMVKRRLNRGLRLLAAAPGDLCPGGEEPDAS
jgi:DNA-directed RNA polymerase specialized sigma24 family protein